MAEDWDPFADPAEADPAPAPAPTPKPRPEATVPPTRQQAADVDGMAPAKQKLDQTRSGMPAPSGPPASQAPGGYPSRSAQPVSRAPPRPSAPSADAPKKAQAEPKKAGSEPRSRQAFSQAVQDVGSKAAGPKLSYDTPLKQTEESLRIMLAELEKLKLAKAKAVEEEEFEEAGVLKRRIKVLEDSIGEYNKRADLVREAKEKAESQFNQSESRKPLAKPKSQMAHGEALLDDRDIRKMRILPEEADFMEKKRDAMRERNVTDNTVQGVPKWAYEDVETEGISAVKTVRPAKLSYQFKGAIEDEKWEEGAFFQTHFVAQVPVEMAFGFLNNDDDRSTIDGSERLSLGPGVSIAQLPTGVAQLQETIPDEVEENKVWAAWIVVHKPRVPGKVKMEAARTVKTKEPFQKRPFYAFRAVWRFRPGPAGGTHITRIVFDFKQYELLDFDALNAVSRTIEIENEQMRVSWSAAVALVPDKTLAAKRGGGDTLAVRPIVGENEMYSASFVVDGFVERVFEAMISNELLSEYQAFLSDKSYLRVDEHQSLIRQVNGIVLLNNTRVSESQDAGEMGFAITTLGHLAGRSIKAAQMVTRPATVLQDHFYRLTTEWTFSELSESETTVHRKMHSFRQTKLNEEMPDLANALTEAADLENRKIISYFRQQNAEAGNCRAPRPQTSISLRANYAMRAMPELLDHAAKNHVLEVREMLEVRGADPNYIHIRTDAWTLSDSRIEFFEEMTPLIVASERGATDVMKVLFNHPQLDANLCCCAFNDMEIYNYYTAYDMTITRKHPHAAALLRARGVLPASSEHVFKPPFDRVHMRPLRENVYDDDDEYGEGEMPAWDTIAEGNPKLAKALENAANTLSMTKVQSKENRQKVFKDLLANWHPDRHATTNLLDIATKVFQWLQVVKKWYLEEGDDVGSVNMPLPDNPDADPRDEDESRQNAREYLHPSGSVFTVW